MSRGLGTHEAASPALLSMLMFEPGYLRRLIAIGEADAETHLDEVATLIGGRASGAARSARGGLETDDSGGALGRSAKEVA
jgi:hypothetical protein